MNKYQNTLAVTSTGLPFFSGMSPFAWHEAANSNIPRASYPAGLTSGGRIVFERTKRPVSTCNALAALAGIGQEIAR